MPNLVTWMRASDTKWFRPIFAQVPEISVWNARTRTVVLDESDGLLLTGGPDISEEFLKQPVADASLIKSPTLDRDRWEFEAMEHAISRGLPVLAICKGMQLFNVALGGTLRLDIPNHNGSAMRDENIQPLRNERAAKVRFSEVNSSHHQAVENPGDACAVEAWCANDDIIEQMRLRNYPYALAVQYHPERHPLYAGLFADFLAQLKC